MNRKDFIKKTAVSMAAGLAATKVIGAAAATDQPENIGFNHIPNPTSEIMDNIIIHRANTRGHANHGWLDSKHTFSFANYHNPERMNFGVLRVLNDDTVEAGMGFGTHPHNNMEIISIPLEGDLEHKDSMGTLSVIKQGDVQVMSAGTGIQHSEYNKNKDKKVKFLQIWIFPKEKGVKPRYDQMTFKIEDRIDKLQQILSPNADDEGVWIHQDAWFHLGKLSAGFKTTYKIHKQGNGVYFFVLNGKVEVAGQSLEDRDGLGIVDVTTVEIKTNSAAELLVMEVPMI